MSTPNQQPKNTRPIPSKMYFTELPNWKFGKAVVEVRIGEENEPKELAGTINLLRYDDNKRPQFSAHDVDGNEIFLGETNRYQLQKHFKDNEIELIQTIKDRQIGIEEMTVSSSENGQAKDVERTPSMER